MRTSALLATALALCTACRSTSVEPDTHRKSRTFDFVYKASVPEVPSGAKEVKLWIPVPDTNYDQKVDSVTVNTEFPYTIHPIRNGSGRALCVTSPGKPISVEATYHVTRYETRGGGSASPSELEHDLGPDKLVPLNGKVAAVAASMPSGDDSLATARALYDHTVAKMRYDKPEGQPWGRGDAEWACDSGFGNCTDFHSYYIGLARTKKIPARFEIGFALPTGPDKVQPIAGYHCWAFFWNDHSGWVPIDASEARKNPAKTDYFFGTLDENRVTMTGGRDVQLDPMPASGPRNFFVYPYAEADGAEVTKITRAFEVRAP